MDEEPTRLATVARLDAGAVLRAAIERDAESLRRAIELYVLRAGLATGRDAVAAQGEEVFQEVVVRALARTAAFDVSRQPRPWLLGIALNVIRERQRKLWQRRGHEAVPTQRSPAQESTADPLGLLVDAAAESPYRVVELLDLVEAADRRVLHLRYVENCTGPALVPHGACARVPRECV